MSGGRFLVGLREVNTSERILAIKSLLKESISFWEEDVYPDSNLDLSLMQLNKDLQDVSVELENTSLEQNSIEVAAVVSGYIAKKMIKKTKCSDCRVLLTFNSRRGPIPETYDYLLKLSRGGLTLPASDLTDHVCKSFAMLRVMRNCHSQSRLA